MKQIMSADFIEAFFAHLQEEYAEEIAGYSKGFDLMSLFNRKHIGIREFADDYITVAIEQMEEADPNCEQSPEFQQLLNAEETTTDDSERLINGMTIHDTFTKEAFSSNQSYNHYKYQFFLVEFQLEQESIHGVIGIHLPFFGQVVYSPKLSFKWANNLEESQELFTKSIQNYNVFNVWSS